jgi:hypothetical protein
MRAIIQENYGEAENVLRLGQVGRPAIGDRELLLRVHAAGADRSVWHLLAGLPYAVRLAGYRIRALKTPVPGRGVAGADRGGRRRGDDAGGGRRGVRHRRPTSRPAEGAAEGR